MRPESLAVVILGVLAIAGLLISLNRRPRSRSSLAFSVVAIIVVLAALGGMLLHRGAP